VSGLEAPIGNSAGSEHSVTRKSRVLESLNAHIKGHTLICMTFFYSTCSRNKTTLGTIENIYNIQQPIIFFSLVSLKFWFQVSGLEAPIGNSAGSEHSVTRKSRVLESLNAHIKGYTLNCMTFLYSTCSRNKTTSGTIVKIYNIQQPIIFFSLVSFSFGFTLSGLEAPIGNSAGSEHSVTRKSREFHYTQTK